MPNFSITHFFAFLIAVALPLAAVAQDIKPTYCDELPMSYEKGAGPDRPSLPKFSTLPTTEYKVQVAILRFTSPEDYPFHSDLVARFRPCEQVWVVESRQSFTNRDEANVLRRKLDGLGYRGCYLVELVGYQ